MGMPAVTSFRSSYTATSLACIRLSSNKSPSSVNTNNHRQELSKQEKRRANFIIATPSQVVRIVLTRMKIADGEVAADLKETITTRVWGGLPLTALLNPNTRNLSNICWERKECRKIKVYKKHYFN